MTETSSFPLPKSIVASTNLTNNHILHFTFYNLTQEDLAQKVGVRRETIGFLEKGKYNPSLKLAYKVAKCLNSTLDDLFIFDESDL